MPDIDQLMKDVKEFFQLIGTTVPSWLGGVIALAIALVLLSKAISYALSFLNTVKNGWSQLRNPEEMQRCRRRQNFAEHIKHTIQRLDSNEEWEDERFVELEVKVERRYRVSSLLPFSRTGSGPRLKRSLSKALESRRDRLILLEGEPGSGKSVALRHFVYEMAKKAKRAPDLKSIIPIYVNLKELDRAADVDVDRNLIESFVLKSLKRTNDRAIDQFLDDEFQKGIRDGTWFFIFDSFDELPDVLSSTEVDDVVRRYKEAIDTFLYGMYRCRGIVASRQFRGRDYLRELKEWSTFSIQPLSEERRREFIQRSDLAPKQARELVGQLGNAKADILEMASNPLFLALLCEYMKSGKPFPSNTHTVFETYIENRLMRDQVPLQLRFSLDTTLIRETAENIAFCMTADTGIGLSPTRGDLQDALARQQMAVPDNFDFDKLLDALESTKLAQSSDETAADGPARPFTFAHRRFQEYFATCVVLREMARITPRELLTNARWRETAVVLCQTLPADKLAPLLEQAEQLLTQFGSAISDLIVDPLDYVRKQEQDATSKRVASSPHADSLAWGANQSSPRSDQEQQTLRGFSWPSGLYHLLSILQEGFHSHLTDLLEKVPPLIGSLVLSATEQRSLPNRMWALEVAGAASEPILVYLLKQAFADPRLRLKEMAYRQTTYLRSDLPPPIARTIRHALVGLSLTGRLRRERDTIEVYLKRLPESSSKGFLSIMRLLFWLPMLDLIWLSILFLCSLLPLIFLISQKYNPPLAVVEVVTIGCFIGCLLFGALSISYAKWWGFNKLEQQHYLSYKKSTFIFLHLFFSWFPAFLSLGSLGGLLGGPGVVIALLIAVQTLLLVPFALIAAETGTIIFCPIKSWKPWILVPLWQVIWLIFNLPSRLLSLIAFLFRKETYMPFAFLFRKETYMSFVRGPLLSAVKGVLGLAILAGALAVFGFVMSNPFLKIMLYIIGGLSLLFEIIYILSVIRSSNENIHQIFVEAIHQIFVGPRQHRKLWKAFIKDAPGEVTCREWWEAIEKYNLYTLASKEKVIRSTREKRLLAATEETENFINFLEEETEAKLEHKSYIGSLNSGITVLDIQSADYQQFLRNTNDYVLHELRLLLEDVHSRRQGRAYEQP